MRTLVLVAVAMAMLCGMAAAAQEDAPMSDEQLYAEWAGYMEEILPEWTAHKDYFRESLGWQEAPMLRGLVDGYQYSGDEKWLKHMTAQIDVLMERLETVDGRLGWGDSITGEALILKPIFEFIHVATTDPNVSAETKAKAEGYLKVLEPAMIVKWDEAWADTAAGCGTYRPRISLPHNKNAISGRMLLAAARMTPSAERKAAYLDKARKLARRWKKHLKLADDHFIWHYWDPAGPWDYDETGVKRHWVNLEHRGYGAEDTAFVAQAYDHGLVFTREDVEMHVRTFLKEIWNGDDENPVYTAQGTFNPDYVESGIYTELARFSPKIMELWGKSVRQNPRSWSGMHSVPAYLLAKKEAAGFERRNAEWVREAMGDIISAERAARRDSRAEEDRGLVR